MNTGFPFQIDPVPTIFSSGQEVTAPYRARCERKERTVYVEVNSRDRNVRSYPNPSEFRVRLFKPLKDITSIRICGGTIPSTPYNINAGWNSFTLLEGTTRFTITIPPGRYTYTQLATSLAAIINTTSGITNSYSVQFSNITGKFTLSRTAGASTFSLLFLTGDFVDVVDSNNTIQQINSPAKLFGFERADYASNTNNEIQSPNSADLNFLSTRIYVYFNHDNAQDIGCIDRSIGKHQPHTIIYMDDPGQNHKFLNKETFEPMFESYPSPISRISTLDVALRDEFDNLIDLAGRDYTLLLEICYLD